MLGAFGSASYSSLLIVWAWAVPPVLVTHMLISLHQVQVDGVNSPADVGLSIQVQVSTYQVTI